jgi:AcrR family transcriptional regulator
MAKQPRKTARRSSGKTAVRKPAARGKAPARGGSEASATRPSKRARAASERREAILAAGLDEFTAKGFAATRLDDVAKRAGVAKGTIYLHFKDKEALFRDMVTAALGPLIARVADPPLTGGSARAAVEAFAELFAREVAGTRRGDILRLIISEGGRFPALAEFYYREVVTHGIAGMRKVLDYGIARGEIRNRALPQFPQIVVAPAVVGVIWQGLFGRHAPLDVAAMLRVHLDLIFGEREAA